MLLVPAVILPDHAPLHFRQFAIGTRPGDDLAIVGFALLFLSVGPASVVLTPPDPGRTVLNPLTASVHEAIRLRTGGGWLAPGFLSAVALSVAFKLLMADTPLMRAQFHIIQLLRDAFHECFESRSKLTVVKFASS